MAGESNIQIGSAEEQNFASVEPEGSESDAFSHSSDSYVPSSTTDVSSEEEQLPDTTGEKRKRKKADKSSWKRSIVKKKRLSGMKYTNRSGKEIPEKKRLYPSIAPIVDLSVLKIFQWKKGNRFAASFGI